MFGPAVEHDVYDITPTHLTEGVLSQLREADSRAYKILKDGGAVRSLSQMPIVSIPVHFDRSVDSSIPSCQRSMVIRTFITSDFMTGIPATPGNQLSQQVCVCTSHRGGIQPLWYQVISARSKRTVKDLFSCPSKHQDKFSGV